LLNSAEIAAIFAIPDDGPGPSAIAESRFELKELDRALSELPERRRAVFIAAHVEQIPQQ
jgi:RNA polymerase sigma-70 factor, ECF subfamily